MLPEARAKPGHERVEQPPIRTEDVRDANFELGQLDQADEVAAFVGVPPDREDGDPGYVDPRIERLLRGHELPRAGEPQRAVDARQERRRVLFHPQHLASALLSALRLLLLSVQRVCRVTLATTRRLLGL